jgi:hypothetical protein
MTMTLVQGVLILLCFSMAGALGGGLYEHIVLTPYGADRRPPRNFQRECSVDVLDLAQRAPRHNLVPLLPVGALLFPEIVMFLHRQERT